VGSERVLRTSSRAVKKGGIKKEPHHEAPFGLVVGRRR
jgi:hypothetical protein